MIFISRLPNAMNIEPLEARIAPASVSVAFTDIDGDKVKITATSAGAAPPLGLADLAFVGGGTSGQLAKLDLTALGFQGASIATSVIKVGVGDERVDIGFIDATGRDLGGVTVKGDLGQIDAGSNTAGTPAVKSLSVRSLGRLGLDSQGGTGSLKSDLLGGLGSLKVSGDVKDAFLTVTGAIGSITIGGSLIGGSGGLSGGISSSGDMGVVKIGRDVRGGSGSNSGRLGAGGALGSATIGGSVVGGTNTGSGAVFAIHDFGTLKIGGDLIGGSITGTASMDASGFIQSNFGRIGSVTIGGSIIAGTDSSSGALTNNASIRAANDIGALDVKGSLIGNAGDGTLANRSPVVISARGQEFPTAGIDLAIGRVTVRGRVEFANILAGYSIVLNPLNGDAQIGAVKVGGDWAASNLVAGVMNTGSGNTKFGDGNDASIGAGNAGIVAKIASITIKGQVFGTPDALSSTDHFGFVAQQIGAFKAGGLTAVLHATAPPLDVLELTPITGDVSLREV